MIPMTPQNKSSTIIQSALLSIFIVLALFFLEGNKQFSLWDEGYLWYGAKRVIAGEVPIRDFMSYDPGRYYWSAMLMKSMGDDGIMSLRLSVAAFQMIGLFVGIFLLRSHLNPSNKENTLFFLVSALILAIWMIPRHKLFDITLSIVLIQTLSFLIEAPSSKRHFLSGFCIGIVAIFGRNHGIYGILAIIGVILWINLDQEKRTSIRKNLSFFVAGILVGYTPVLLMLVFVPGFAEVFLEGILFLFQTKFETLPIPVPWPWLKRATSLSLDQLISQTLLGLFFVGVLVFGILSVFWTFRQKLRNQRISPILVSASFLSLPYAHYAFSRADLGHLALGIYPLLIGCIISMSTLPKGFKWSMILMLFVSSAWVVRAAHPGWQCYITQQCVTVEVSSDLIEVDQGTAIDIAMLRHLSAQYTPDGGSFIAAPFWPGAYALLDRKSPMWANYALQPHSNKFQEREITRIIAAKPRFAIIFDYPLDGREDLRFRNTHPLIYQYILDNFEYLPQSTYSTYKIFRAIPID